MRISEWIICGYFAYLVIVAGVLRLPGRRVLRVLVVSLVCTGLIVSLSRLRPSPSLRLARDWLPALYLLQGYWLSAQYYTRPMPQVEQALLRFDQWLLTYARIPTLVTRAPRVLLEYLELAYLSCSALVPAGVGVLYAAGLRSHVDRFWTSVAIALLGCYGALPWIQTRPPRGIERDGGNAELDRRDLLFRRLNLLTLRHASIQVNTIPSGHTAGSLAIALVVADVQPLAGAVCLVIALSITVASVVGRYHYAADAGLGLVLGFAAWVLPKWSY